MAEEEVNSCCTGMPMAPGRRRQAAPQQPDSQATAAMIQWVVVNLNSARARMDDACARMNNASARMNMETQRMNNLLAKLQWERCVVPARAAYFQANQGAMLQGQMGVGPAQAALFPTNHGGIRTGGLLNINSCNTPVPRCPSIAHPSQGTRAHDALRVATGGPGAAKKTRGRRSTVDQFAAWLTSDNQEHD